MKIVFANVFVNDQAKALAFYTDRLGIVVKEDFAVGEHRWITVVSPEDPDGPQLTLQPDAHRAVPPYQSALYEDGIPATSFAVADVAAEYERLRASGVHFTQAPTTTGPITSAVLDDTCGNLIQIAHRQA